MTQPKLTIQCSECGWDPGKDLTIPLVQAHYEEEHPDKYENDPANLNMRMYVICPRCNHKIENHTYAKATASGMVKKTYDCPNCHRSYTTTEAPIDV